MMVNQSDFFDVALFADINTEGSKALSAQMPNSDREIADGLPLYTNFIDYFGDDVLGNHSKAWNKHWNSYTSHRNLPRKLLQQEFHVHFLSSSPNATVPEQLQTFISTVE